MKPNIYYFYIGYINVQIKPMNLITDSFQPCGRNLIPNFPHPTTITEARVKDLEEKLEFYEKVEFV